MAGAKGLYKRGNNWWMRYVGPDGRMRFESTKTSAFKEAQAILIHRKKEVMDGKDPMALKIMPHYTFHELVEYYSTWAERQPGFRTSKKYIMPQLRAFFGPSPLRHVSTRIAEEYQSKLLAEGKLPSTANRHLAALKHMFTKAVEWDMVDEGTLKRIRRVNLLPENNERLRYLMKEECQALIQACSPHLTPIVITALNTGMRKDEILSLEWERHVDLSHGVILLDKTKNQHQHGIPINLTLRSTLQSLVRRIDSPYVFTDTTGRRFYDVKRAFHSACPKAGIKDFTFHDLRHTFASHLVMAGVDLLAVKELLGHKTLKMTLRYAHLSPSHKGKAISVLEDALGHEPTIQKLDNLTKKASAHES
jgi:integrase